MRKTLSKACARASSEIQTCWSGTVLSECAARRQAMDGRRIKRRGHGRGGVARSRDLELSRLGPLRCVSGVTCGHVMSGAVDGRRHASRESRAGGRQILTCARWRLASQGLFQLPQMATLPYRRGGRRMQTTMRPMRCTNHVRRRCRSFISTAQEGVDGGPHRRTRQERRAVSAAQQPRQLLRVNI